jgi:hypothetical protein
LRSLEAVVLSLSEAQHGITREDERLDDMITFWKGLLGVIAESIVNERSVLHRADCGWLRQVRNGSAFVDGGSSSDGSSSESAMEEVDR